MPRRKKPARSTGQLSFPRDLFAAPPRTELVNDSVVEIPEVVEPIQNAGNGDLNSFGDRLHVLESDKLFRRLISLKLGVWLLERDGLKWILRSSWSALLYSLRHLFALIP
ncbi:MAG: hypothetical protein IPO60_02605 [Flavobacteriales bacterium]|nr:hypothetical protein [Flavobacteriales bacterium]